MSQSIRFDQALRGAGKDSTLIIADHRLDHEKTLTIRSCPLASKRQSREWTGGARRFPKMEPDLLSAADDKRPL